MLPAISAPRWAGSNSACSIGAAIEGLAVGRIARALVKRFGARRHDPEIISTETIAAELGAWPKAMRSTSG
jgi:hypothetical protein